MAMSARDIYASYGEREKSEPIVIINKKVICNELLSNVLRGIIHCPNYNITDEFMIESLDPVFRKDDIQKSSLRSLQLPRMYNKGRRRLVHFRTRVFQQDSQVNSQLTTIGEYSAKY